MEVTHPAPIPRSEDERLSAAATSALWALLSVHHVYAIGARVEVRPVLHGLRARLIGLDTLDAAESVRVREHVTAALRAAAPQAVWIHVED